MSIHAHGQALRRRARGVSLLALLALGLGVGALALGAFRHPDDAPSPQEPEPTVTRRSGPALRLLDPAFDWGSVAAGTEIVHVFTLRNEGDELLRILKARPT